MTREDECKKRQDAIDKRIRSAGRIRLTGSIMMVSGGFALAIAGTSLAKDPGMPAWVGIVATNLVILLLLGGLGVYICGRSMSSILTQAEDDLAELEAVREEVVTLRSEVADLREDIAELSKQAAGLMALAKMAVPLLANGHQPGKTFPELVEMAELVTLGADLERSRLRHHPED